MLKALPILLLVGCAGLDRPNLPVDCVSTCGMRVYGAPQFCSAIDNAESVMLAELAPIWQPEALCSKLAETALTVHDADTKLTWEDPEYGRIAGVTSRGLLTTVARAGTLAEVAFSFVHEFAHLAELTVGPEPLEPHGNWIELGLYGDNSKLRRAANLIRQE